MTLTLEIRTPSGLVLDQAVTSITAEDRSGWFGIRRGRTDLLAVLPPGLLVYAHGEEEGFVALSGGLLGLRNGHCTVLATEATVASELESMAVEVARQARRRREQTSMHRGVVRDLAFEALRRLRRASP